MTIAEAPRVRHRRRPATTMTPVLWETLKLVAAGLSTPAIAEAQAVPFSTAQDRVKRVLAYFGARSRLEVVVRCYREGIM